MERRLISVLVADLMEIKDKHGDLPVVSHCYDNEGHITCEAPPELMVLETADIIDNKWGVELLNEKRLALV